MYIYKDKFKNDSIAQPTPFYTFPPFSSCVSPEKKIIKFV